MADIVSSLFGLSPQQLQQQRDESFANENLARASLNPQQQLFALAGGLGYNLGKGAGQLFGVEDPMLKQAREMEAALQAAQGSMSEEDMQDPTVFYPKLAKLLQDKGLTKQAAMVMQEGIPAIQNYKLASAKIATEGAQASKYTAEATKASREQLTTIERLIAAKDRTSSPEAKATIQAQIDKEVQTNLPSIDEQIVALSSKKAAGTASKAELEQLDYLDNFKQKVAKAGASSTMISTKVEESAAKKVGDVLSEGLVAANQAVGSVASVNDIRKAISKGNVIVGPGATVRKTLSQIAQVYAGGTNSEQLANTRSAIQGLANLALNARSRLQGSGAISNYEQQTVEKATTGTIDDLTIPEIETLMSVVERDAKGTYDDYNRKLKSVQDKDLVNIFTPKSMPTSPNTKPTSSIVDKWRTK